MTDIAELQEEIARLRKDVERLTRLHNAKSRPYEVAAMNEVRDDIERKDLRLLVWALKAYTIVEWASGFGLVEYFPRYDADELLLDAEELLGVTEAREARSRVRSVLKFAVEMEE